MPNPSLTTTGLLLRSWLGLACLGRDFATEAVVIFNFAWPPLPLPRALLLPNVPPSFPQKNSFSLDATRCKAAPLARHPSLPSFPVNGSYLSSHARYLRTLLAPALAATCSNLQHLQHADVIAARSGPIQPGSTQLWIYRLRSFRLPRYSSLLAFFNTRPPCRQAVLFSDLTRNGSALTTTK